MSMIKIIDEETKKCEVALNENLDEKTVAYFKSIGFVEGDFEVGYNGIPYLKGYAPEKPTNEKAAEARAERDRRIDAIRWRIERYQTQEAAGLETTDTAEQYKAILLYVQALRDVPEQAGFPDAIEWPEEP